MDAIADRVVLVIDGDDWTLSAREQNVETLLKSWGYDIQRIRIRDVPRFNATIASAIVVPAYYIGYGDQAYFWDKFMDQPFSVRHLHTDHDSSAREVIVGFLGRNEWDRRAAGRLLGRIRDIPCGGKVLRAEQDRVTNTLEYHVEQLPGESDDKPESNYREPGLPGEL